MLADVREAFLHDPEDLDLLVGCEADSRVDLEVDLEVAVGDEEVDVATKRRVEWSGAARRRESEDREPSLLLRENCGLFESGHGLLEWRSGLERELCVANCAERRDFGRSAITVEQRL